MRAFFGLFLLAWLSNSNAKIAKKCKETTCKVECNTVQDYENYLTKPNVKHAEKILNSARFDKWFPTTGRHENYTHGELLKAISLFDKFCKTKLICKRHLSFLLAHARQETDCLRIVGENIEKVITSYTGGPCYKGRGLLQLTHDYNYAKFSKWYYGKGKECCLVDDPEKVAKAELAILSGIWFFSEMMNSIEDDDFGDTTKAINGVQECGHPDSNHMKQAQCRYIYFKFYASEIGYKDVSYKEKAGVWKKTDGVWKKTYSGWSTDCTKSGGNIYCVKKRSVVQTGCEAKGCWFDTKVKHCWT